MTAQPPQREYIITEEQLQRGHEIMSKTGRKKYEREIRIRPHLPAPESFERVAELIRKNTPTKELCKDCGYNGVCKPMKGESCKSALARTSASKATLAENKRVLDDLETFVRTDRSLNRQIGKRIVLARILTLRQSTAAQEVRR
jgi:hypothetical protein